MSNLIPGITFSLSSPVSFSEPRTTRELINSICSAPLGLGATKYGHFQGEKKIVATEELVNFVSGGDAKAEAGSLVLTAGEYCEYQIEWNKTSPPSLSFVGGFLMRAVFENESSLLGSFLDLIKTVSGTIQVAYGDIRSMEYPGWDTPFDLNMRLPDIPNVSIYGKPYIELFGRDRIESAPFYAVEKLSDDAYWLQATEEITDEVPIKLRKSIRKHFGEDAFMSDGKWRYLDGQHPSFEFS